MYLLNRPYTPGSKLASEHLHGENVDDVGIARGREGRTQAPGGPGSRARPRSTS